MTNSILHNTEILCRKFTDFVYNISTKGEAMKIKVRNPMGLLVFAILVCVVLACGGGKPAPPKFQGDWVGENGTTLYMYSDGKAGFRIGSKRVTGGKAEIDESAKTLTISLFGISNTWKIDKEPSDNGEMTLDGKLFRKKT